MENNNNKKHKTLSDTRRLLFCLLALFLLSSLLSTVLPLEMPSSVIGSSGTITYSPAQEPPPPPPPPIEGYFAYTGFENVPLGTIWQGTNMNWDVNPGWQEGNYPEVWWHEYSVTSPRAYGEIVSHPLPLPNGGDRCLKVVRKIDPALDGIASDSGANRIEWKLTHLHQNTEIVYWDIYISYWYYIPSGQAAGKTGWWSFFELKEFDGANYGTGLKIRKTKSQPWSGSSAYWDVEIYYYAMPTIERKRGMHYHIYPSSVQPQLLQDGSTGWSPTYAIGAPTINPHEVPIGRWFKLEIYIERRHDKTGKFKVWLTDPLYPEWANGKLLFATEGCYTAYWSTPHNCDVPLAKAYGFWGEWYEDEVRVYNYNPRQE